MTLILRLVLLCAITIPVLPAAEPVLKVVSLEKTLTFTAENLAALPHMEIVALDPHAQKEHRYTGVTVRELLARVGAPLGDKLRGAALQLVVVFRSRDNYAVAFALADFDEAFSNRTILLAEREDDKPLPENAVPFRLVAPGDKKAARWARMVASIEITPAGVASATAKP